MITLTLIEALGAYEACAEQANHNGYCTLTVEAFHHMFGPEVPVGQPQTFEFEGTMVTAVTIGTGVPPHAFP